MKLCGANSFVLARFPRDRSRPVHYYLLIGGSAGRLYDIVTYILICQVILGNNPVHEKEWIVANAKRLAVRLTGHGSITTTVPALIGRVHADSLRGWRGSTSETD